MEKSPTPSASPPPPRGIRDVAHFVAVASGKGGVGKTTVAVNLALALANQGYRIGLLDADIYGPSIPTMLDLHYQPEIRNEKLIPLEKFGLRIMSIGFMTDPQQPIIWRGPLVARAIRDFLDKVMWGALDYLIVDLPPGTGDASITVAQILPDAGIVIVTTPQPVAVADVKRAATMFRKMGRSILGVVENMSYFCCAHSEEKIEIFGQGGGEELGRELGVALLGALPIDIELRKCCDEGVPLLVELPECDTARTFTEIARKIVASITAAEAQ